MRFLEKEFLVEKRCFQYWNLQEADQLLHLGRNVLIAENGIEDARHDVDRGLIDPRHRATRQVLANLAQSIAAAVLGLRHQARALLQLGQIIRQGRRDGGQGSRHHPGHARGRTRRHESVQLREARHDGQLRHVRWRRSVCLAGRRVRHMPVLEHAAQLLGQSRIGLGLFPCILRRSRLLDLVGLRQIRQHAGVDEGAIDCLQNRRQVEEQAQIHLVQHQVMRFFMRIELAPGLVHRRQQHVGAERVFRGSDLVAAKQGGHAQIECGQQLGMGDLQRPRGTVE